MLGLGNVSHFRWFAQTGGTKTYSSGAGDYGWKDIRTKVDLARPTGFISRGGRSSAPTS
jgi:hypothetical protein